MEWSPIASEAESVGSLKAWTVLAVSPSPVTMVIALIAKLEMAVLLHESTTVN